jgi:thiamine biosynthesis protein ThiI
MKLLALLSGGIDSAVACYLMIGRAEIDYLHFALGEKSISKVKEIVSRIDGSRKIYVVKHSALIEMIRTVDKDERYTCIYCKRGMLRIAELLAEKIGCDAILTGDSLGQVASQTIPNLYAEDTAIKIPVLRPLIGMDKEEIIEIAKKAGTYEISILEDEGCSYVPKYPVTKARIEYIKEFSVDSLLSMIKTA